MRNQHSEPHYTLRFAQAANRTLEADIIPTIATPGIRVTIDPNNCTGNILLYLHQQDCTCSHPAQCPYLNADTRSWTNFPCNEVGICEQILARFMFNGAKHPMYLVNAMRALVGVNLAELPIGQRAALEVLSEMEWTAEYASKRR